MRQQPAHAPADLPDLVDHWEATGVITPEQAARMRADLGLPESGPAFLPVLTEPPRKERPQASLAIEALGYLGSVLIVVASALLASEYWNDLATAGHLLIVGSAAVLLLLAGFAVPDRLGPPGQRMHAVLWLGATVAAAGFVGVFGNEVLDWHEEDLALLVFAATAVLAAVLWWRLPTVVQQVAVVAGLAGTAASAAAQFHSAQDYQPGLAVWGVGAIWFVLGWGGVVRPRWTALLLGGIVLLVGSGLTMSTDGGVVLALVTVAAMVTLAVLSRDLLVLVVGAWGALQTLPSAINTWFPGQLAAAAALLVAGTGLVTAAIWIARRREEPAEAPAKASREYAAIPARAAVLASAGIAATVAIVVVALGVAG
jgi:hypothetical protein